MQLPEQREAERQLHRLLRGLWHLGENRRLGRLRLRNCAGLIPPQLDFGYISEARALRLQPDECYPEGVIADRAYRVEALHASHNTCVVGATCVERDSFHREILPQGDSLSS